MKCRHCSTNLTHTFLDLGSSPPSNSYLTENTLHKAEKWYPLRVLVCDQCWLVQTEDFVGESEMFSKDYAYFSSFSESWLQHAQDYTNKIVDRFGLGSSSNIVEIAANDGYLLQYVKEKDIPCYGIEPTHSTASAARDKGIDIVEEFFGVSLAEKLVANGKQADLIVANNVLAHVPDINDFVRAFAILLKSKGVATFEFPHLLNLISHKQFDTIYHEHYSYLSLISVQKILGENGLDVFDVEEIPTHGGSLRVYAQNAHDKYHELSPNVSKIIDKETQMGIASPEVYERFQSEAEKIKHNLLRFLLDVIQEDKTIVAYGAAAKGNTLMNYAGIRPDLLSCVVDRNPNKFGKYMPGSRIPIVTEQIIKDKRPDYVLILPWNLKTELENQLSYIRDWQGRFVVAVPKLVIW